MLLYPLVFENRFLEYFTLNPLLSTISFALFNSSILFPIIGLDGATTPIVSPIFNFCGLNFGNLIFYIYYTFSIFFNSSYFLSSFEYSSGFNPNLVFIYWLIEIYIIVNIIPTIISAFADVVTPNINDAK